MVLLSLKGCNKDKKLEAVIVTGGDIGSVGLFLFYISSEFIYPSTELLNKPVYWIILVCQNIQWMGHTQENDPISPLESQRNRLESWIV